jgi:hypothetical protein
LSAVLANPEQWGILIVEEFDQFRFSLSMAITVELSFLVHLIMDDLGQKLVVSLRVSFEALFVPVTVFGVLSHPALIDIYHDYLTARRMSYMAIIFVAAILELIIGRMMSPPWLRQTFKIFAIVSLVAVMLWKL